MLTLAATSEAPKDRRYDASARGLAITSTKRDQSMPAVLSTIADSGSNTMADRKNVVNPSVIPKPGMTLGSRWPAFLMPRFPMRPVRAPRASPPDGRR